jgi:hypothetical protein
MDNQSDKENIKEDKEDELIYTYNRELFYRFDKEKGFTQEINYQDADNQVIIKQSWDAAKERLEAVQKEVAAGKISPVAYHMERILMETPMLAAYMGISVLRVKWHMRPWAFNRLSRKMLEKYARIFEITVDELKKTELK